MLIKVKAFPESDKDQVLQKNENSFEVFTREKPVLGRANRAIISLLAAFFKIPENKIILIKGFRERSKIFEIEV